MDDNAIQTMATVRIISNNLDIRPDSWRDQLPAIRYTTSTFEILDTVPSPARRQWQLPLISVFQRVAFGDADSEPAQDVADWCLRQSLRLLELYPEDIEILSCELSRCLAISTDVFSDRTQLAFASTKVVGKHLSSRSWIVEQFSCKYIYFTGR
jgi:hypothetical protein